MLCVTTTTPDPAIAEQIARALVERQLAACVQVSGPVTSVYRWRGQVETSQEWQCTAKTLGENWDAIVRLVEELHPYETPELIATPIDRAAAAYGRWLVEQSQGSAGSDT